MATKVVKVVRQVGHGDDSGISFPKASFLKEAHEAFLIARRKVRNDVITGPARIYVVVEQDFVTTEQE